MLIISLYVISCLIAFGLFCFSWKRSFDEVTIGDALVLSVLSLGSVCSIAAAIVVLVLDAIHDSNFMSKKLF